MFASPSTSLRYVGSSRMLYRKIWPCSLIMERKEGTTSQLESLMLNATGETVVSRTSPKKKPQGGILPEKSNKQRAAKSTSTWTVIDISTSDSTLNRCFHSEQNLSSENKDKKNDRRELMSHDAKDKGGKKEKLMSSDTKQSASQSVAQSTEIVQPDDVADTNKVDATKVEKRSTKLTTDEDDTVEKRRGGGDDDVTTRSLEKESARIRAILQQHRVWLQMPLLSGQYPQLRRNASAHFFNVASFNVLAQDLLEDNSHLYGHCQPQVLLWEYRRKQILREIVHTTADVVCLQEVQANHFDDFFVPQLRKLGFEGTYKKRTGSKPDGCAVFWKPNVFQHINTHEIEFARGSYLLGRDNVALVVTLKSKQAKNAPPLHIVNTHLLFNPRRGDIKLAQLRTLLAEIDQLAFRKSASVRSNPNTNNPDAGMVYDPIIMCGDFNCLPFSPLHSFVVNGVLDCSTLFSGDVAGQLEGLGKGRLIELDYNSILRQGYYQHVLNERMQSGVVPLHDARELSYPIVRHPFRFFSTYSHVIKGKPEVSTAHQRACCTVDYIFYHFEGSANTAALLHTGVVSLLTENEMRLINSLPNERLGSDHISLIASFVLRSIR